MKEKLLDNKCPLYQAVRQEQVAKEAPSMGTNVVDSMSSDSMEILNDTHAQKSKREGPNV